jgi:uncharacterized membrane protein YcaP (DUF421 family)
MEIIYILIASLLSAFLVVILQCLIKCIAPSKPITLMKNSKINSPAMKKAKISIDELMSRARLAGYFNLGDIDTAIFEPCREISFLPMPMKRPLNPKDFNFAPVREGVCKTVILNGSLIKENIRHSGISEEDIIQLLNQRGEDIKDILIATVNEAGRVDFFEKYGA